MRSTCWVRWPTCRPFWKIWPTWRLSPINSQQPVSRYHPPSLLLCIFGLFMGTVESIKTASSCKSQVRVFFPTGDFGSERFWFQLRLSDTSCFSQQHSVQEEQHQQVTRCSTTERLQSNKKVTEIHMTFSDVQQLLINPLDFWILLIHSLKNEFYNK